MNIKSIIPKSRNQKILDVIRVEVYRATNKASSDIQVGLRNKTLEFTERGSIKSGIFLTAAMSLITKTISESCQNLLVTVEVLQQKWNQTFSDKLLDSVAEIIIKGYQGLIDSVLRNSVKDLLSTTKPPNRTVDLQMDSLRKSIFNMVNSKISEIKLTNKIRKEDPGVRESKKSNWIAILSLIIAILSLIISILSWLSKEEMLQLLLNLLLTESL